MHYIRPKFKISQRIWVISDDNIKEIEVESIQSHGNEISYLSKNHLFKEEAAFASKEEADDFIENAIRIPNKYESMWRVDASGIRSVRIDEATCYFKEDLKKPYNATYKTASSLNDHFGRFYEDAEKAAAAFVQEQRNLEERLKMYK